MAAIRRRRDVADRRTSTRERHPGEPERLRGWDRRAAVCLVAAVLALAAGLVLALSQSDQRRAGSNGVKVEREIGSLPPGGSFCQSPERLPRGTAQLGITIASPPPGPQLAVRLSQAGRPLQQSSVPAGWGGSGVLVPIAPPPRDLLNVEVCVDVLGGGEAATLLGGRTPPYVGSLSITDGLSVRIEDFRPGRESWWSYGPLVAERLGLGRGWWGGDWVAWLIAGLVLTAGALAVRLALRTIVADRPTHVGRTLVVIGCLNAIAWSLITPPFQVLDEDTHFAFAQEIAERGRPPVERGDPRFSPALRTLMADTHGGALHLGTDRISIWSQHEEERLERNLAASLSGRGNGDAGPANPEPPLYYALAAIPYKVAGDASLLTRFQLMRLLSAAMGGLTALFAFLFLREALPSRRWAWSVGGLVAAFVPMVGAMSGGVNPDALLYPVAAALLYTIARAFRQGMTTRLAVWIGVVLAIGLIGKINLYGMLPGALVALALAARRGEGAWNRRVAQLVAIPVAIGLAPFLLLMALDALVWDRGLILVKDTTASHREHGGLGDQLAFLWQFYLPRLPWQSSQFPLNVGYDLIFKTFVGEFGRLAVLYPEWVYRAALGVCAVIGVGAIRALVVCRAELRRRRDELLGYGLMVLGMLVLIDLVAFRGWAPTLPGAAQGRYLLPLLALLVGVVALAARGAGARWGRAAGAAIVVVAIAWSLFGQLLTVAYYYG